MKWNYLCEPKSSSFTFLLVIFSNAHRKSKSIQARWMQANTEEEKNIVMQMNKWEYANWINFKWIVEPKDLKHIAYKYVQNKQFEAVAFGWNVKEMYSREWLMEWWCNDDHDDDDDKVLWLKVTLNHICHIEFIYVRAPILQSAFYNTCILKHGYNFIHWIMNKLDRFHLCAQLSHCIAWTSFHSFTYSHKFICAYRAYVKLQSTFVSHNPSIHSSMLRKQQKQWWIKIHAVHIKFITWI